jgi:hypothetical protein
VNIIYKFSLYFIFYIIIDYLFISLDNLQKIKIKIKYLISLIFINNFAVKSILKFWINNLKSNYLNNNKDIYKILKNLQK